MYCLYHSNCSPQKNAVFQDVTPCSSCVNRRFVGTCRLQLKGRIIHERGNNASKWLQTEPPVENTAVKTSDNALDPSINGTEISAYIRFSSETVACLIFPSELEGNCRSARKNTFFAAHLFKCEWGYTIALRSLMAGWSVVRRNRSGFRGTGHVPNNKSFTPSFHHST